MIKVRVVFTQIFDPYDVTNQSGKIPHTDYGFKSASYDTYIKLIDLRSRMYSPMTGRFTSKDSWLGDYNRPLSLNRWNYVEGNPINYSDPTGNSICYDPLPVSCQNGLIYANAFATIIKDYVKSGSIQPVEGFAWFADLSKDHFEDTRDLVWAMTIVLDDMDANRGFIWEQATYRKGAAGSAYWIGSDWLPYQNDPSLNNEANGWNDWCDPHNRENCSDWIYSRRGDWNPRYWDKTANQAYHFWFYVAVTYFDAAGDAFALLANNVHDRPDQVVPYDFIGSAPTDLPPYWTESTQPDRWLADQGLMLGWKLRDNDAVESLGCPGYLDFLRTDIGSWIRTHLK